MRLSKRWRITGAVVAILLIGIAVAWWIATRPPRAISVNESLDRFRKATPTATPSVLPPHPAIGVYVYDTQGSERVSAGVVHRYPKQTTVTVSVTGCGLQVRWDALAGRRSVGQVCARDGGWQLTSYTDVHKFLYLEDVHAYTCDSPVTADGGTTTTCRGSDTVVTSTLQRLAPEGGLRHIRIIQHGTGKSKSDGTTEAWLLPNGLPQRVTVVNHGSQQVLGSVVTYDEKATFTLTSQAPRR